MYRALLLFLLNQQMYNLYHNSIHHSIIFLYNTWSIYYTKAIMF